MISIPILQMRKPLFGEICAFRVSQGFLGGLVKYLPAMWGNWVLSLGQEDPMEKGMATHGSIPAWKIPETEKPGVLQSMGLQSGTGLSD